MVERSAQHWARTGQLHVFMTAFSRAAKLRAAADGFAGDPQQERHLCHSAMHALATAYLPLVPTLRQFKHCAIPLWAVVKTGCSWGLAEELLARLGQGGCEMVYQADGQSHANLWWSLSEAPQEVAVRYAELLAASATQLVELAAGDIGPQACSNILLACARLLPFSDPAPLLHHLTACVVQLLGEGNEQDLANSLYALGRLHEQCGYTPHPDHLDCMAEGVLQRLGQHSATPWEAFAAQGLSNMLWAFAKLRYPHQELLTLLAGAAGGAAGRMGEQVLSNSIWALGRLVEAGCLDGSGGVPGVQSLTVEVTRRVRVQPTAFSAQHISNILLGLAHLQSAATPGAYRLREVVEAMATAWQLAGRFQSCSTQQLSNTAWAVAKLDYSNQAWYADCVAAALQPKLFSPTVSQQWASLWWALATARHRPAGPLLLMSRTADAMAAMGQRVGAQDCSITLWALATIGLYDSRLVGGLLGRLVELLPSADMDVQALANSLWALAVMGPAALSTHVAAIEALLREVARRWQNPSLRAQYTEEGLTQLWQAQLELQAHPEPQVCALAPILQGASGPGAGLLAAALASAKASSSFAPVTRGICRDVIAALQWMQQQQEQRQQASQRRRQQQPEPVASSSGGGASGAEGSVAILSVAEGTRREEVCRWVHVEVRLQGGRLMAVVVDGHKRLLANAPHLRDGHAQLRLRQLQRVYGEGNVVGVSAVEWEALGGDLRRQEELLRGLLVKQQQQQPGAGAAQVSEQGSALPRAWVAGTRGGPSAQPAPRAAAAPSPPRPPTVQELVRQRLLQVAPQAKGRKRARPPPS